MALPLVVVLVLTAAFTQSQTVARTPELTVQTAVAPGGQVVVLGSGFSAKAKVDLAWEGKDDPIPSVTADAPGRFEAIVTVPESFEPGNYTIVASETRPNGRDHAVRVDVTVVAPAEAASPSATARPSATPAPDPTVPAIPPSPEPTATVSPTVKPTVAPTAQPTVAPTVEPTVAPTVKPTVAPTVAPTPSPTVAPTKAPAPAGGGIWVDRNALMKLPMSGPAWDAVASAARSVGTGGNVADQNSNHDVQTLGAALYAVRTGDAGARSRAIAALESAIGTERGGRWLAVGRNLGAYVIAADLLDLRSGKVHDWLASFMTMRLSSNNDSGTMHTLRQSAWNSGSNAAAQEGFAHAALAAYLGNDAELAWGWNAFRRYAGDRTSSHRISSNNDSWQQIPSDPVGIQNAGATKDGKRLDGAISNDMSRGGDFKWPPGYTQYPWVGLEGAVPAAVVFERAGYPAFEIQSSALKRAADYLWEVRNAAGDEWYDADRAPEVKHLLNWRYGFDRPARTPAGVGRTVGFTDWTHP